MYRLLIVQLHQLLHHVANLVPDMVLIVEHAGLVQIELSVGGIFLCVFLELPGKGQCLVSPTMQING